jgi:hypothetical protein
MWRSVALNVGLCGLVAGCSLGGGGDAASTGPPPTSYQVTRLVKPRIEKVGRGEISGTQCAVESRLRAKCDFDFSQGFGSAMLVSAWFQLRPSGGGWSVVPICRGAKSWNPLCSHNVLHLTGTTSQSTVGQ